MAGPEVLVCPDRSSWLPETRAHRDAGQVVLGNVDVDAKLADIRDDEQRRTTRAGIDERADVSGACRHQAVERRDDTLVLLQHPQAEIGLLRVAAGRLSKCRSAIGRVSLCVGVASNSTTIPAPRIGSYVRYTDTVTAQGTCEWAAVPFHSRQLEVAETVALGTLLTVACESARPP